MNRSVRVKRIYSPAAPDDGLRVLVDRLWPRGVSRERAALDHWLRDVAPSTGLRRWYGHQPDRAEEFRVRYLTELSSGDAADALLVLRGLSEGVSPVTLLTATAEIQRSHATVLRDVLADPAASGG